MQNLFLKILIVVISILNVWLFWPADLYFLNDDLLHIPLTDGGHLFQTRSVRPIHELLVTLDLKLWGKQAFGFHLTALVLHAIVCFQLYFLSVSLCSFLLKVETAVAKTAGLVAVVLFLCYAQHSESIAWILGRTPILSAIFLLSSMQLFLSPHLNWAKIFVGALAFALCLFTYEQAILFPALLALLAWYNADKLQRRKQVHFIVVLMVVTVGYLVVRKIIALDIVGAYEGQHYTSFNLRVLASNSFRLVTRLWLNPFYKIYLLSCVFLLVVLSAATWITRKYIRRNIRAIVFFVVAVGSMLLPVVSLGISVRSFESGRYLYLPALFLVIGLGAFITLMMQNKKLRGAVISLSVFVCSYWLWGKYEASQDYKLASKYSRQVQEQLGQHFLQSSEPLTIDTLHLSIGRLPVFRLGFKTGAQWLHNADTSKIMVRHYTDEAAK